MRILIMPEIGRRIGEFLEKKYPDDTQSPNEAYRTCRFRDMCIRRLHAVPNGFIQWDILPCPCSDSWFKEMTAMNRAELEAARAGFALTVDADVRRALERERERQLKFGVRERRKHRTREIAVTQMRLIQYAETKCTLET